MDEKEAAFVVALAIERSIEPTGPINSIENQGDGWLVVIMTDGSVFKAQMQEVT
jgi:hypothetical protein